MCLGATVLDQNYEWAYLVVEKSCRVERTEIALSN
jgi:hypothetical protein